jgi:ubiquinone/menaquinone biosynthesis C-methylase UbiE
LALLVVTLLSVLCQADSYKDQLVEKYPFYRTASGPFAPVYPALAEQIVQDFAVKEGVCVDVGGGCGMLAMALVRITNLTVYVLDIDPWAIRLCNLLVDEAGLTGRVRAIEGDAQDMPFRDNFADLVVSRGSIFFWPDQLKGLKECYRILKPGGVAYVGGGFSRILDPAIRTSLAESCAKTFKENPPKGWKDLTEELVQQARDAGISNITMEREPIRGKWLIIRK